MAVYRSLTTPTPKVYFDPGQPRDARGQWSTTLGAGGKEGPARLITNRSVQRARLAAKVIAGGVGRGYYRNTPDARKWAAEGIKQVRRSDPSALKSLSRGTRATGLIPSRLNKQERKAVDRMYRRTDSKRAG